uniref:Uncharacterized protein n=1 Tax=Siphoviridae sp. ctuHu10 TaxID=2826502 RepID=A0A8S5NRB0_9CAUD|nr:MAG TPA: hypothetical protein [Siphoviridae sp. ctuHu10]
MHNKWFVVGLFNYVYIVYDCILLVNSFICFSIILTYKYICKGSE